MSWKEKLNIAFRITTGDGVTYSPLLSQDNNMSLEMMASSFEFSGIDGSLVKRKATAGRNFSLVFYFTGDAHLDNSDNFIESAKNKKPWNIEHPKYGDLYVQPITIKRQDSNLNSTVFSVEVRETINQSYPNSTRSKQDSISSMANDTNLTAATSFGIAVKKVTTENKLKFTSSLGNTYEQYKQDVKTPEDSSNLENAYQKSLTAVDSLDIPSIQSFILAPASSASSVTSRLGQFTNAYNEIIDLSDFSLKEYFQSIGATILAGMCLSSVNPNKGDYSKRKDISNVISTIQNTYSNYITKLGEAQDDNLSIENAFNTDPEVLKSVDKMVKETVANLNEVIFGALVENTFVVPYPTNLIMITHHLIGRVTDEYLNEMISFNDFSKDEIIQINKGRKVIYYA
jgi:hypothetical protein